MDHSCSACKCLGLINDGNDFLSIHNGGSDDSEMVAKFTGKMNDTDISIQENQMFLVFHTNREIVRKGFHALIMESKCLSEIRNCIISLNQSLIPADRGEAVFKWR